MRHNKYFKVLVFMAVAALPSILYFSSGSSLDDIAEKKGTQKKGKTLPTDTQATIDNASASSIPTSRAIDTYAQFMDMKLPDLSRYSIKKGPRPHDHIHVNSLGRLADAFNDSNYLHYQHAEKIGISPIYSLADAYNADRPLVKIASCDFYEVDKLKHSLPYLVPEAALLLKTIGRNFIDSLGSRGADGHKIIVTSLLRTPHTVKKLRRVNVNATDSSTHQLGTTFDISYTRFATADSTRMIYEGDLKNLLAEVLYDLRAQNRCFVKFERHTACFHVTAIR